MKILVTAGPTREPIDPVRFLSNRSSGRMGFAIAAAASARGHEVVLVAGPVGLATPKGVRRVDVETAEAMYAAVERELPGCDAAVMCAAVADYRPVQVESEKIKKSDATLTLVLERTRDILGSLREMMGFRGYVVGFAAETSHVIDYALSKLKRKGCDLVVANDVSRTDIGFDQSDNEITLLYRDGRVEPLPKAAKDGLAEHLIATLEEETA